MPITWFSTVVDCHDPEALAAFWCQVLGYQVVFRNEREVDIAPGPASFPGLAFLRADNRKTVKNRLHIDVRVGQENIEAEVKRLTELGGTYLHRAQQGPVHWWITMADPEGNEFCIT